MPDWGHSETGGARIDPMPDDVRVVYRCKTPEEAERRVARANAAVASKLPFFHLLNGEPPHKVLFVTRDGQKVRTEDVRWCSMTPCSWIT